MAKRRVLCRFCKETATRDVPMGKIMLPYCDYHSSMFDERRPREMRQNAEGKWYVYYEPYGELRQ